jgi:hypothetical protein
MTKTISGTTLRGVSYVLLLGLATFVSACELEVENPGPVQADALEDPKAVTAVVNGAGRDLAEALNWTAYTGGAVALEIFPAGSTGSFGITPRQQAGKLVDDDDDTHWNFSQRARWTAEDAVARIKRVLDGTTSDPAILTRALIWAGYANRHLGENFCEGVIDGGPPGPYTVYLERAEANFTEALAVGATISSATVKDSLVSAATGGRAAVRLLRNNLTGAAADAATLPSTFAFRMRYFSTDLDQYNRIYWASANQPYRAHTVWNTFYDNYRKTTRDPRVPFDSSATQLVGDAAVGNLGRVRWYFQTKYPAQGSPINLSTGWEMRLIEAEAKLVAGDVAGAMTQLNLHRVALGLTPWTAANATEAWTALKRERGIELWLESRRLGDFRRWAALSRPGTSDDMTGRDLCFATPLSEKQTNPNF